MRYLFIIFAVAVQAGFFAAQAEPLPEDGLILWLKPESLSGMDRSRVRRWADSGAAENDAVQPSSTYCPVLREGQVNGHPAVMFETAGQRMILPQLQLPYETTVFIVSFDQPQIKTASVHHPLLAADNDPYRAAGDGYGIGYYKDTYDGVLTVIGSGSLSDICSLNSSRHAWEVITFHKQMNNAAFFRDGYERWWGSLTLASTNSYHTGYLLGGSSSGRDYLGGIAEVIVYSRALNTNEISAVHNYLSTKFDIPIAAKKKVMSNDPRFFRNGTLMLDSAYIDQPYIVKRADQWMAVATRSDASEAGPDRRLVILSSTNAGATWSERANAPETNRMPSWGTLLQTPSGRVYCFYNLNRLPGEGVGVWYAYRYSDDWGTSWSSRYILPVRETWHEKTFSRYKSWGIDDPVIAGDTVYLSFTKRDQGSATQQGEGFIFKSTNILTAVNAQDISWEMLPAGDRGIKLSEFGPIQEEHNIESLGGDDLYCAFRTLEGYIGESYSTNGGTTWTEPDLISDVTGRKIKNPRACAMVWRCENGKYLLWSHNNDGRQVTIRNKDRSLVWLRGGIYKEGRIQWSQPEPALFTCAPFHYIGLSYPDLTEDNGRYYISATDKQQARLCEINTNLLADLWNQESLCEIPSTGLIYDSSTTNALSPITFNVADGGFTVTCIGNSGASSLVWSALDQAGDGAAVRITLDGKAVIELKDRHMRQPWIWESDEPVSKNAIVSFIVDGAANWVYVVIDGELCDGGASRQYGFGQLPYQMAALTVTPVASFDVDADRVLVHDRAPSISETIGMHRAITVLKE